MTDLDKLHHTASAIINAEKPGENTSQRVGRLFDDIISAIGELSGRESAPLDAAAQVPEWHMPPGVFDVVGFHGFVEPGEVSIVDSEAAQTMGSVVCCGGRFVFLPAAVKPPLGLPAAYTSWRRVYGESHGLAVELHEVVASDRYGMPTAAGVEPSVSKIYIDTSAHTAYIYDGAGALVPLGAGADHAAVQRVREELAEIRTRLDLLLGADDSDGIDSFGELMPFLSGVKDTDTLTGLIEQARAEGGAPAAASPDDIDNVINTIFS